MTVDHASKQVYRRLKARRNITASLFGRELRAE